MIINGKQFIVGGEGQYYEIKNGQPLALKRADGQIVKVLQKQVEAKYGDRVIRGYSLRLSSCFVLVLVFSDNCFER